jgi:hypothetical protein
MVSAFLVEVQTYLVIHNCAAVIATSSSIRNATAPRYLARASNLRGSTSLNEFKWATFNPDRVNKFIRLILESPTIVFAIGLNLPVLSDDRCIASLGRTIQAVGGNVYIKEVDFKKCRMLTNAAVEVLVQLRHLEFLDISFTRINEIGKFGVLPSLEELRADGVLGLTSELFEGIERAPRLRILDVGSAVYGGFASFNWLNVPGAWRSLQTLKLKGQSKRNLSVTNLPNLIKLDISRLGQNEGYRYFSSDEDEIEDPAGDPEDLAENCVNPLVGLTNLRTVLMPGSNVIGFKFLLPVRDTLITLDASGNDRLRNVGAIRELYYLNTLSLASCRLLTDAGLKDLKFATSLAFLDLSRCRNLKDVNLIGDLTTLRHLRMENNYITRAGTQRWDSLMELEVLSLKGCYLLETISHFAPKLPNLKSINISECTLLESEDILENVIMRTGFVDVIEDLDVRDTKLYTQCFEEWAEKSTIGKRFMEKAQNGNMVLLCSRKATVKISYGNTEGNAESENFMDLLS